MGLFSGAVLLAKDGRVVVEAAYGNADVEAGTANEASTAFKLMSVSKSITAVAVMRLAGKDKLALSDPVGSHLPHWPDAWREVTVRQLLDHTSGVPNLEQEWGAEARRGPERGLGVWARLAPRLAKLPHDAPPGTRPAYSNFNYVLLGLLLEKAAGRPYGEVLCAEVLGPAAMERTGVDDGSRRPGLSVGYFRGGGEPAASEQDMSLIEGAGGLYSTVGDLYRLDRALRGDALLSREVYAGMVTVEAPSVGYACGWQVSRIHDRTCVHHSGGANGYVADFLRFPDDDACVVVLSNFAFAPAERISHDLAAILFGKAVTPARKVEPRTLDRWMGLYRPRADGRALLVRRSGDLLMLFDAHVGVERCGGRLLIPLADDLFVPPCTAERLRFTETGLVLEALGQATAMERVEVPAEPWRAAIGEYATGPKGTAQITEALGSLRLRDPGGWPVEQEVLPLSGTLALALHSEDFGMLFHLERGADGSVLGFRRQRIDGKEVHGVRRDP
jgi:CubicO group peptidase (beta-lactamase class C family)